MPGVLIATWVLLHTDPLSDCVCVYFFLFLYPSIKIHEFTLIPPANYFMFQLNIIGFIFLFVTPFSNSKKHNSCYS